MSETDRDSLLRLDEELARMSRETPEAPADFHSRWMSAVREEAGQREENQKKADREESIRQLRAGAATEEAKRITERKNVAAPWRRLASVAASMVILLSGVMIARNAGWPRDTAARIQAVPQSVSVSTQAPEPEADRMDDAPVPLPEPAAYEAVNGMMSMADEEPEAEEASEADMAWEEKGIRAAEDTAVEAGEARKANAVPAADTAVEVEEAAEAPEEAAVCEDMAVPALGAVQEEKAPDIDAGEPVLPVWPWVALGIAGVIALILLTGNKNVNKNGEKGEQKDV